MPNPIVTNSDSPDNPATSADFLRLIEVIDDTRALLAETLPLLYAQYEVVLCAAKDFDELDDDFRLIHDMCGNLRYPNKADMDALRDAYKVARAKLYRSMSYPEYLKTEHWQQLREKALDYAGHRCQLCNTALGSLHVHHRTYDRRGCEEPADLIVLCADCHQMFHNNMRLAS